MHHSDQLYVFRSARLRYPSPLIVFSKCQDQTDRRRRHRSHLATMRPNAKQGKCDARPQLLSSCIFSSIKPPIPEISQGLPFVWYWDAFSAPVPPWWSSNYSGLQNSKSDRIRAPLHPSMRYHIRPRYYCGLRPQAESSTVINLAGFDSAEWE